METEVSEQKYKHVRVQPERVQKFDKLRQLHKLFRSSFITNSLFGKADLSPVAHLSDNNYKNDFSVLLSPINQSESRARKVLEIVMIVGFFSRLSLPKSVL